DALTISPPGFELEPSSQERPAISATQAFAQGLADMATWGLSDEAAAVTGVLGGMLPGGHGKGYNEVLQDVRAEIEAGAEQHPYAHLAGQVVGGVGTGYGLVRGGLSLAGNAARAGRGWFTRLLG